MKNTKNLFIIALIASSLILGTNIIPMQSYAVKDNSDSHDETEDWGEDFSKDSKIQKQTRIWIKITSATDPPSVNRPMMPNR